MENNPYSTPSADLNQPNYSDERNQEGLLSMTGRIGRLRYLAYSFGFMMVAVLVGGVLAFVLNFVSETLAIGVAGIAYLIAVIYTYFVLGKRRLNDRGHSGWFSLLWFVPVVSLALFLYLIFAPGDPNHNEYGAPPRENNVMVYLGSLVMPFVGIGILAAVALPAYQDYVERSQQAQFENIANKHAY